MKPAGRHIKAELLPEAGLSRRSALALISAAGDTAVVVDGDGVVRDAIVRDTIAGDSNGAPEETNLRQLANTWIGNLWIDTVVPESRASAQAILHEVKATGTSHRRQLRYSTGLSTHFAFVYSGIELDPGSGHAVFIGHESKVVAAEEQRIADTQQSLERDHWRMRNMETRYRLLHQLASDAVMVEEAPADPHGVRDLTQAVERLSSLVGRVALRDLVRDTTELVERHFIQAALELTDNNRSAAAGVLGLSRQSLYVKLRRQQLATPDDAQETG